MLASFCAEVSGFFRAARFPVMITGLPGSSSRAVKPRSPMAPSPAVRNFSQILLWRAAVRSEARPGFGRRDPQQVPALVGDGEEQQAVGFVLAGVVAPILFTGTASGAHQCPVDQDLLAAGSGDCRQRPRRGSSCSHLDNRGRGLPRHGMSAFWVTRRQAWSGADRELPRRRRRPRPRPAHPPGHLTTRRFAGCARSDGGSVHGCKSVGRDTVGAGIEFAASCQGGDFLTDSLGGQCGIEAL